MDLNTKQRKKNCLTLEARHTISIEVANKIREKLTPRIFLPKTPLHRHTTKLPPPNATKELTPTIPKREILKNQEFNTKLPVVIVKNFVKHLEETSPNSTECDNECKTMDKNDNSNTIRRSGSLRQTVKILRKNVKRAAKDLDHACSLAHAIQNLEQPIDVKFSKKYAKLSIKQFESQDVASSNWENFKNKADDNSAKIINNDGVLFSNDPLALTSPTSTCKDKKASGVKNRKENFAKTFGKFALTCAIEYENEITDKTKNTKKKSKRQAKKKLCDTKSPQANKVCKHSNEYIIPDPQENTGKAITNEVKSKVKQHSFISTGNNGVSIAQFQNIEQHPSVNENIKTFNTKVIENKTKLPNIIRDNLAKPRVENCTEKTNQGTRISSKIKFDQREQQPLKDFNKCIISNNEKKDKLLIKKTNQTPNATGTNGNHNPNSTANSKNVNTFVKHPLDSQLYSVRTAVADFQDAVRSSISQIYDCSPLDKNINGDLMDLESSMESFYKYLVQSYNDVDAKERKTNKCIEYLRENMNRRSCVGSTGSQTSSQQQPKPNAETLTIFIEVDKMPRQTITYKTSDILCPTSISENDTTTKDSSNISTTQTLTNSRSENPQATPDSSEAINSKPSEVNTNATKSNSKAIRLRRKVTPKKGNAQVVNTQNQASTSVISEPYTVCEAGVTSINTYNLSYTQAQNYNNSFLTTDSLKLASNDNNSTVSTTNQILTNYPAEAANCNNYYAIPEDLSNSHLELPEYHRKNFYTPTQNFNRESPNQVPVENPNRFEYHSALLRVPYLKNHYVHHGNESNAYNSQTENFYGTMCTTNTPTEYQAVHNENY